MHSLLISFLKQGGEMNIFCLKQGEVLKPSGPSVACEQQTYFGSEDGKYVCGSQASRSAAHRPHTPLTSPGWHEYPPPTPPPGAVHGICPKATCPPESNNRKRLPSPKAPVLVSYGTLWNKSFSA